MVNRPCAALLDRVGGDRDIFVELCDMFLEDAPLRLALIRTALVEADATALAREAHAFKGAASAFDAGEVVVAARELERQAAAGELRDAHQLVMVLESHGRALIEAVKAGRSAP